MSDASKTQKNKREAELEKDWKQVKDWLREHPDYLRGDGALLSELHLWNRAANVVEFGPAALTRMSADKSREKAARKELEQIAQANFAAQAQTHAAVIDLLESRNHSDLARRVDDTAQLRFGLAGGVIALERPGGVPAGWRGLDEGMVDLALGSEGLAKMGQTAFAEALFGPDAGVRSVAMIRMAIWAPARQGVLAFGSPDPEGFTRDMGVELVAFLARVVERTAERWPVL
ncbi:MAG: DUF484 family protein [Caulobacteraceae bacterium]|nr:DUF484 family protein [Caulobacteraceae bacterium]